MLEEVIVTAERRVADVQDIAASVAVRSGDELAREGKSRVDQILADVPGISGSFALAEAGAGTGAFSGDSPINGIAIRGVRSNAGSIGLPNTSTTAVYVDGVYNGVGGTHDIDRVEVLRGPQGTLYGRSATGGVVAFYTRDPNTNEVEGNASIEVGNYDLRHVGGAANFPVVDGKFAVRVSADQYRRQGYDFDYGSGYSTKVDNARVKALFTPAENLSILLGVASTNDTSFAGATRYIVFRSSPDSWQLQLQPQFEGSAAIKHRQYWGKFSWDLGPVTLTYLPAYRTFEKYQLNYSTAPQGGNYRERNIYPDDKFLTHELQLSSNPGSKFVWQVGAIHYNNDAHFFSDYYRVESGVFAITRDFNRETTQYGVYGEATYPLTDRTRITAGLRYDETKVALQGSASQNNNRDRNAGTATAGLPVDMQFLTVSGDAGKRDFKNSTYKLRLEQDLTQQSMAYAMVSSAFVPGDVAISAGIPAAPYAFKAETMTSYEVGLKSRFLDNRLQVNGAVFYYDYGGRQVSTQQIPGNSATTITLVLPAKFKGAELETLYQLTNADRIGLDAAYVSAKYTGNAWRNQFAYEEIGNISPLTIMLSYDHEFTLPNSSKLTLGADARYTDSYLATDVAGSTQIPYTEWARVKSYTTGNAHLDWTSPSGRWEVGSYVRNVADKRYKLTVGLSNLVNTTTPGVTPTGAYGFSDPRTYGVSLRAKF